MQRKYMIDRWPGSLSLSLRHRAPLLLWLPLEAEAGPEAQPAREIAAAKTAIDIHPSDIRTRASLGNLTVSRW